MNLHPHAPNAARWLDYARQLAADTEQPAPTRYWAELATSAGLLWTGVALLFTQPGGVLGVGVGFVAATLGAFRGLVFLHDVTHLGPGQVPGLRAAWNALLGVPLLVPSFVYERCHPEHHRADVYGTTADPEYQPYARQPLARVLVALSLSLLVPSVLVLRFLVLNPLSLVLPPLRRFVDQRLSSLAINPAYVAAPMTGALAKRALRLEVATTAWTWLVAAAALLGWLPWNGLALVFAALHVVAAVNNVRALASHRYASDGARLNDAGIFEDSVNVEGPSLWARIAMPPGAEHHALHHLTPKVPFHALRALHERLRATLPPTAGYHRASEATASGAGRKVLARAWAVQAEVAS